MRRKKHIFFLTIIVCFIIRGQIASGDTMQSGREIRIGIIDTGVLRVHDAFNEEQFAEGKNFVFPEQGTEDKIGHGTRIASLIIGVKTQFGNISGTAPEATVVPLVYQSRYPSGVTKNGGVELLEQSIRAAIDDYNCRVLCISSGINTDEVLLREVAIYAERKGVVIVAAVGNDNEKNPKKIYYPAAYDTVIGIGALDENDKIAEFSQRHGVFATVQGKNITALSLDGTLKEFSGTSYANAYAAGIVADLLSEVPDSSPEDIRNSVALSSNDLGAAGYDSDYGWGKINAEAALEILKSRKLSDNPKAALQLAEDLHSAIFKLIDIHLELLQKLYFYQ